MSAQVVYSGAGAESSVQGNLFRGQRFWLAQKVPTRSKFLSLILANGGEVVKAENQATLKIVDHARKEVIPDTYSYTYIQQSIDQGMLANPADHVAGPPAGTIRGVGSTSIRPKGTRTSFTAEDDKLLVAWVRTSVHKGVAENGNDLYKQLESHVGSAYRSSLDNFSSKQEQNSRHPWQSWRDRYQKVLSKNTNARLSPVSEGLDSLQGPTRPERKHTTRMRRREGFSEDEAKMLLDAGKELLRIPPDKLNEIWEKQLHRFDPERKHTSSEWRDFWESTIRPKCLDPPTRSLHKRLPPIRRSGNTMKTEILGSDPPESQEAAYSSPEAESPDARKPSNGDPSRAEIGRSDTSESQEAFFSSFEALEENGNFGRKRKGPDDLPLRLQEGHPRKRRRQREIPSTPDLSPKRSTSPSPNPQPPLIRPDIRNEKNQNWETETSGGEESAKGDSLGREASPILAEHYRIPRNTQKILEAPIQVVDLGVATPQGGWGSQSTAILSGETSFEPSQDPPHSQPSESRDQEWKSSQPREQEPAIDQVFTNMTNTQQSPSSNLEFPSLFIPERASSPPSNLESPSLFIPDPASSPPHTAPLDATPRNPSPQAEVNARIDAWIERHVRAGRVEAHVIRALESTSLDPHLADDVLGYMDAHGGKIPEDMRGVWTARDDADTQSSNAAAVERVYIKHGDLADFRWTYLAELRKV